MATDKTKLDINQRALEYHACSPAGKIATALTKPFITQDDLSLAYTPGVAAPVLEIASDARKVYDYTNKGNCVAVISDGSAVLGLGNVGALASKPVMEGKGVLFKKFANIDVVDIEVQAKDADEFISTVVNISSSFGGINLEDIAAPDCFYIEKQLKNILDIPIFHDDQHGTAIIVAAGLLNALELQQKALSNCRIVCLGAGAAAIASMRLLKHLGVPPENILMLDRQGVITTSRQELTDFKREFATNLKVETLSQALQHADVLIGLSGANLVSPDIIKKMDDNPIIFALSNPDPEITPKQAYTARDDLVMATGRSDFPNQVNNVLGFPFIFRGALDVRATTINTEMEIAAVHALAALAREPVPADVLDVYKLTSLEFSRDYILPKPFDPRLRDVVSGAVAQAAIKSGVAQHIT